MKNLFFTNILFILYLKIISALKEDEKPKNFQCISHLMNIKPTINNLMKNEENKENEENNKRFLQNKDYTPIRIYADYTYLNTQTKVDKEKIDFLKNVLSETIELYSILLSVKRPKSKIRLLENCQFISTSMIDKEIVLNGIDTDLIIFPFFDFQKEDVEFQAYAGPCSIDPINNRPISGILGVNPKYFQKKLANSENYFIKLFLHEINHILSFNIDLFGLYIDPNNNKKLGIEKVLKSKIVNNFNRTMIITPKVIETAKKHFSCNEIEGVELENQGTSGSANNHWESRIMLGDFMMSSSYMDNFVSDISLALFEDSGWYKVNYYTGGLFKFGKNQGCGFLNSKCIINSVSNYPGFFCDNSNALMCSSSKTSRGFCYMRENVNKIDGEYRYFNSTNTNYIGFHEADYCPVINSENDRPLERYFATNCNMGMVAYPQFGETIGKNSACFVTSLINSKIHHYNELMNRNRAICYSYNCDYNENTYNVTMMETQIKCPKAGDRIKVEKFEGFFYCPDFNSICTKKQDCDDSIECIKKKVVHYDRNYDYILDKELLNPKLTEEADVLAAVLYPYGEKDVSITMDSLFSKDLSDSKPILSNSNINTTVTKNGYYLQFHMSAIFILSYLIF
jgi:hypothetical protein